MIKLAESWAEEEGKPKQERFPKPPKWTKSQVKQTQEGAEADARGFCMWLEAYIVSKQK